MVYDDVIKNWQMIKDVKELDILNQYSTNGRIITISYISIYIFFINIKIDVFKQLHNKYNIAI